MSNNAQPGQLISLEGVSRSFVVGGAEFLALDRVSLELPRASFAAVVGRSGSGKSTLVNLVAGLDHPTAGRVTVGGVAVSSLGEDELARWRGTHVGVVFQSFQLLPALTVLENVTLPMDFCGTRRGRAARERARELLDAMGIVDQAGKLPLELSGGQQQRAAIARALANDPQLVVADEPTGNLDVDTADAVIRLLRGLSREGRTVLMVTHDADVSSVADFVVKLSDGRVVGVDRAEVGHA
ncbi:MAG: ABC transporter ATP-binding protein [Polyangiaceae bacterium]